MSTPSLRTKEGQKARRDRWRDAGLCTSCGHKAETPPKCEDCRERNRKTAPAKERNQVTPLTPEKLAAMKAVLRRIG